MSDPTLADGYVRTVATYVSGTTCGDVEKIDLVSTIAGTMSPGVKTVTTFTTPTIAVTETPTDTVVSKRGRKTAKVDFVRFDSSETIFVPNMDEDSITRAKIKDEITR